MIQNIEVRFKKIHPDAKLPMRNHGNRKYNDHEINWLKEENARFEQEMPEQYASGYRIGFPLETDANGQPTELVMGTGDTGYDIFGVEDKVIPAKGSAIVDTGIEVAYISPGYWFKICPRSGMGFKCGIQPHLGVIDNGYRGNLGTKLYNFSDIDYTVIKGDRIAQMVFYPVIEPRIGWVNEKVETHRNESGFGSSGK